jgi:hypothetical protein
MAEYFLDSSALVKRYVRESGSAWIHALFDAAFDHEMFIAGVTGVEMVAAIARRARGGSISATDATATCRRIRSDLTTDYQVIEMTERLLSRAMTLAETHGLRGYDAVQLAAGCEVNALCVATGLAPVIFVSADRELNAAAAREGLLSEDPCLHG